MATHFGLNLLVERCRSFQFADFFSRHLEVSFRRTRFIERTDRQNEVVQVAHNVSEFLVVLGLIGVLRNVRTIQR